MGNLIRSLASNFLDIGRCGLFLPRIFFPRSVKSQTSDKHVTFKKKVYTEDGDKYNGAYHRLWDHVMENNQRTPCYQRQYQARPTADMNPYQRVPPIRDPTKPKVSPQGYVNPFLERKQREQSGPDSSVHKIKDYRKMQQEVQLGGLGPDLDSETYTDKAVKKVHQENFAREVMMRNRHTGVVPKTKPPSYAKDQEDLLPKSHVVPFFGCFGKKRRRKQKKTAFE